LDSSSAASTLGDAGLAARLRGRLTRSAATAVALLNATTFGRRLLPLRDSAATFSSRRLLRLDPLSAGLLPLLALLRATTLGRCLLPLALLSTTTLDRRLLALSGSAATFGSRRLLWLDLAAGLLPLLALLDPTTLGRCLLPLCSFTATFGSRRLLRLNPLAAGLLALLDPTTFSRRLLPLFESAPSLGRILLAASLLSLHRLLALLLPL
jgi:hypothetical protein